MLRHFTVHSDGMDLSDGGMIMTLRPSALRRDRAASAAIPGCLRLLPHMDLLQQGTLHFDLVVN